MGEGEKEGKKIPNVSKLKLVAFSPSHELLIFKIKIKIKVDFLKL